MVGLKVKKESLSKRCEICHLADKFDPYIETCLRCVNIIDRQNKKAIEINPNKQANKFKIVCLSVIGSFIGIIMGSFMAFMTNGSEWEVKNKTIMIFWLCLFLGQKGLPYIFINSEFIKKIAIWSVIGSLSSIFGAITWHTINNVYQQQWVLATMATTSNVHLKKLLNDYFIYDQMWSIKMHIIVALIFGSQLGPIIGSLATWYFSKFNIRKTFFTSKTKIV